MREGLGKEEVRVALNRSDDEKLLWFNRFSILCYKFRFEKYDVLIIYFFEVLEREEYIDFKEK